MSQPQTDSAPDRRCQILDAALVCFAKRGFHQTSMHDISAEAGISVGLIYRYFENKEAAISGMADRHKKEISEVLQRAKQAPTLLESLEILFTAHCCEEETPVVSAFIVDLYAEASRNPRVADLVRDVLQTAMAGVTELISRAPEAQNTTRGVRQSKWRNNFCRGARNVDARCVASTGNDREERRERQLEVTRKLWSLLVQTGGRTRLCMT